MHRKDYLSLLGVAKIYLFVQLFITPLLLGVFEHSALERTIRSDLYFPLATSYSLESVSVCVLAYICFLVGSMVRLPQLCTGVSDLDWHSPRVVRMFWITFLTGFAFKLTRLAGGGDINISSARVGFFGDTAAFLMSLNWFHMLALPFLAIAYYENVGRTPRIARYYPWVLLCYVCNGTINGATSFVIFPLATHLAIRQRYRPIGGRGLAVGALLLLAIIYLKVFLKVAIIDDPNNKFDLFAPLTVLINRISLSFVVSAIVDNPHFDYGYGIIEQFLCNMNLPAFSYAIPDGNLFGRFYSIISPEDGLTGIAISIVGDFLLQWGLIGACLGMFATGVLYRWVSALTSAHKKLSWVVYAMLWPIMLHGLESPVSVLWSTVLKMASLCIAYYFVGRYLLVPSRDAAQRAGAPQLPGVPAP